MMSKETLSMRRTCIKLAAALLLCVPVFAMVESFSDGLNRLHVDTVLVLPSQAIDEYPIWSFDSEWVAANVEGRWVKLQLDRTQLVPAKWHGMPVAAAEHPSLTPLSEAELKQWQRHSSHHERAVRLPAGGCVQLSTHELSTALEVTDSTGKTRRLWSSDVENCSAVSLSPDRRYIAYICELNGLMVSDVNRLLVRPGTPVHQSGDCDDKRK
jgi:hypothetical protein